MTTLGRKVVASLKWMMVGRFTGQLITWVITILVIRILTPEDYGLMAMAMVFIGLLTLFEELGLAAALIQEKTLDPRLVEQVFGLLLLFNVALYLLLWFGAPIAAAVFGEMELSAIVRVAGVQLLIQSIAVIPDAMLSRRLDFRNKSLVLFVATVGGSILTLVLALTGFGVWSLVFGNLCTALIRAAGLNFVARYACRPRFELAGIGRAARFGGLVTADRLLWYVYSQSDVFIIGKLLGKELLGFYSVAMHLAALPMRKIAGMLSEVGFSAFSRLQDDREALRDRLCQAISLLSLAAFPVFFGISATAPYIVGVFLGERWLPSTIPIQLLSIVIPLRLLSTVTPTSLYGAGRADVSMVNTAIACLMMPLAFLVGVQWGLVGVCIAWLVAYPLYFLIALSRGLRTLGLPIGRYMRAVRGPAWAASLMYLALALARFTLEAWGMPQAGVLVSLIVLGAVTYAGLVLALCPDACRDALSALAPGVEAEIGDQHPAAVLKLLVPRPIKAAARRVHQRWSFRSAVRAIDALPAGVAVPVDVLSRLHYGWGNTGWSADLRYLGELGRRIYETGGPVLECGSGLTTVLAGLLLRKQDRELWALEHEPAWRHRVQDVLDRFRLDNVHVGVAPLRDYGEYSWYEAPAPGMPPDFSLVICDGPPAATPGGRYGLLAVMRDHLGENTVIVVDDADRDGELRMLARWQEESGARLEVDRSGGSYVVCKLS